MIDFSVMLTAMVLAMLLLPRSGFFELSRAFLSPRAWRADTRQGRSCLLRPAQVSLRPGRKVGSLPRDAQAAALSS